MPCLMQVCSNPQAGTPKTPCLVAGTPKAPLMADTPKVPCHQAGTPKTPCLMQVLVGQRTMKVFRGEALMQVS